MAGDWARKIYQKLEPHDPVARNAWLIGGYYESADELQDKNHDWEERAKRIYSLRAEAMKEIWSVRGIDGALSLLPELPERAAWDVGHCAASCASDTHSAMDVLRRCLATDEPPGEKVDGFMSGFIGSLKDDVRTHVLSSSAEIVAVTRSCASSDALHSESRRGCCSPDGLRRCAIGTGAASLRDWYSQRNPKRTNSIDRLLEVDRPRAAFSIVRFDWEKVETSRLKRLLVAVATVRQRTC